MNSKLSAIGIYGVLMSGLIFTIPLSNTDGKVFAQTAATAGTQSSTSKANTITTVTIAASSYPTSNAYLNFNRAEGTIANVQDNEVKTNGKEMHSHSIYSFKLTHTSINNLATVFSGIATVTMKDGPHIGVPISISILNQRAMSIWIDPTKTNNHFGNAPIYGTIGLII